MVPGPTWKFTRVCGSNPTTEPVDQKSKRAATGKARDISFLKFMCFGFRNAQTLRGLVGRRGSRLKSCFFKRSANLIGGNAIRQLEAGDDSNQFCPWDN